MGARCRARSHRFPPRRQPIPYPCRIYTPAAGNAPAGGAAPPAAEWRSAAERDRREGDDCTARIRRALRACYGQPGLLVIDAQIEVIFALIELEHRSEVPIAAVSDFVCRSVGAGGRESRRERARAGIEAILLRRCIADCGGEYRHCRGGQSDVSKVHGGIPSWSKIPTPHEHHRLTINQQANEKT